jgi:cyclic beta-1,2-glucan synthetase
VLVTASGGGYSRWKDIAVTRWHEDLTRDHSGSFCYIRDTASGAFWSNAWQPTQQRPAGYEAIFTEGRAEFHRQDRVDGSLIETRTEIVVSPEDDIELRRIRLINRSGERRRLEVTSYAEVVLAAPTADALHPAFSKLFVQTEILRSKRALLCTRRPRTRGEQPGWLFHLMAVSGAGTGDASFETDRARFIGRGRTLASPLALTGRGRLSGSQGSVLDPIVAIRQEVILDPDQTATIDLVTGAADARDTAEQLVDRYQDRASRQPGLRPRVDAQPGRAAAVRHLRGRGTGIRAPGRLDDLRQRVHARRRRRHPQESPRAIGPVGLRDLRRPADRAAADRGPSEDRPRPAAAAGTRVLAHERPGR